MSRLFYHVMQDNLGNLLFDVSGTMRLAGTGTVATIYGDEALTVPIANPMTNHPSFGSFKCFLGAGDYDFYMAKSGYTFETLTGVQGHGTMAQQNASAVAITGGTINGVTNLTADSPTFVVDGATHRVGINIASPAQGLDVNANTYHRLGTGFGALAIAAARVYVEFPKATQNGLLIKGSDGDSGAYPAIGFQNVAGTQVGFIYASATATNYSTASDVRLKHAITPLTGALDVVRALKPITGRWRADDSPLVSFLAHEVQQVVGGVVTGEADAVDEAGNIVPQMIDYSKLVPYLTAALKEALDRIEALTARLDAAVA